MNEKAKAENKRTPSDLELALARQVKDWRKWRQGSNGKVISGVIYGKSELSKGS